MTLRNFIKLLIIGFVGEQNSAFQSNNCARKKEVYVKHRIQKDYIQIRIHRRNFRRTCQSKWCIKTFRIFLISQQLAFICRNINTLKWWAETGQNGENETKTAMDLSEVVNE